MEYTRQTLHDMLLTMDTCNSTAGAVALRYSGRHGDTYTAIVAQSL